ncbi:MAG: glycosyltransferase family protein [Alphaproteobacteria bacterium]
MARDAARILIVVQHLWGIGHVARTFAIAGACAGLGARVQVALGGPPTGLPVPHGVETVQLPSIRAADQTYRVLIDEAGDPVSQTLWDARRRMLLQALEDLRPSHVVTEHFPFGRRKQRAEFTALINRARSLDPRPRIVASVRDIVEDPGDARRRAAQLALAACWFDAVLVHGDPTLIRLEDSLPHMRAIRDRLIYTGYVHRAVPAPTPARARRGVVVSAGGGRDAGPLIEAVLDIHRRGLAGPEPWTLVTGRLARTIAPGDIPPGLTVIDHDPDLPARLAGAGLSISRAGYNTVAECLAAGTPMILVPRRDQEEEREQALRAGALSGRGRAVEVSERDDTPLAEQLIHALRRLHEDPHDDAARSPASDPGGFGSPQDGSSPGRLDRPRHAVGPAPRLDGAAWTAHWLAKSDLVAH